MARSSQIILTFIVAGFLCAVAPSAFAQQTPGERSDTMRYDNPPGRGGGPSLEKQEQIRKRVEMIRVWRLTEALQLDQETSAKLSALMSSCEQQRGAIFRERRETMQSLREAVNVREPAQDKLTPLLEKLEANMRASHVLADDEWKRLQGILSTEQRARFVIFQQDFRRDIHRMISGAREGKNPLPRRHGDE